MDNRLFAYHRLCVGNVPYLVNSIPIIINRSYVGAVLTMGILWYIIRTSYPIAKAVAKYSPKITNWVKVNV